jgi:hypothetical protein
MIQMESLFILRGNRGIGLRDAYKLNIFIPGQRPKQALRMAVHQPHNRNTHRRSLRVR